MYPGRLLLLAFIVETLSAQCLPAPRLCSRPPALPSISVTKETLIYPRSIALPPPTICETACSAPCNRELILPPLSVQLPPGCGFSESAIPLVASAYGSCSCGTFVEPYYCPCGCESFGCSGPVVVPLSGNGCGCGYPGFGVSSVPFVLPSCGCGCGLTLATPVCPSLAALAVPVVL